MMSAMKWGCIVITKTKKRETQAESKKRISPQWSDALLTVEWLNYARGSAVYQRVLAIRDALEPLQSALQALQSGRKISKQEKESIHKLNQTLARYTYVTAIGDSPLSAGFQMIPKDAPKIAGKGITCTVTAKNRSRYGDRLVVYGRGPAVPEIKGESISFPVTEAFVVLALGRLANQCELAKVRLCEQCRERWRVSGREMDRFCSDKCRAAFYQKSPEHKKRMAKNQKNYRDRERKKDRESKQRAHQHS